MKANAAFTITSLISILLFTVHFADDIVRGMEKGDLFDYTGVVLVAIWLYATLVFAGTRSGLAARRQLLLPVEDNYFCRRRAGE